MRRQAAIRELLEHADLLGVVGCSRRMAERAFRVGDLLSESNGIVSDGENRRRRGRRLRRRGRDRDVGGRIGGHGGARGVVSRRGAARNDDRGQDGGDASHEMRLRGGRVYEDLTYEEQGHVGVITLRRPEARNALTFRTYAELEDAVRTTTARCLVITGADPAFCSGDDVKVVMGGGERPPDVSSSLARAPRLTPAADALLHTDIPVVAAINGAAVGWGMELSLMADFRVASERAKFGELFVLRGLVSDAPGLGRLAQLVGREKAAEMLMTGDVVDAVEALRIGLVESSGSSRRADGDRARARGTNRCEPAACGSSDQARSSPGARSRLERGRRLRLVDAGRALPDRRPPRGRSLVPREAAAAISRALTRPVASLHNRCFAHPGGALRRPLPSPHPVLAAGGSRRETLPSNAST